MKTLKIISFVLITITFSSCYFLDRFIPEEYFAYEEPTYIKSIWISHPAAIQCEVTYFYSLEYAKNSMRQYGIEVYNAKTMYSTKTTKCGLPTGTYYNLRIRYEDFGKLYGTLWKQYNYGNTDRCYSL